MLIKKAKNQKNHNKKLDKCKCPPAGEGLRNYLMEYYTDMKMMFTKFVIPNGDIHDSC